MAVAVPASAADVAVTVEASVLRFHLEEGKSQLRFSFSEMKTDTKIGIAVATVDVGAGILHIEYALPLRIRFTCCRQQTDVQRWGRIRWIGKYNGV